MGIGVFDKDLYLFRYRSAIKHASSRILLSPFLQASLSRGGET